VILTLGFKGYMLFVCVFSGIISGLGLGGILYEITSWVTTREAGFLLNVFGGIGAICAFARVVSGVRSWDDLIIPRRRGM
jgi:hypothetical protein